MAHKRKFLLIAALITNLCVQTTIPGLVEAKPKKNSVSSKQNLKKSKNQRRKAAVPAVNPATLNSVEEILSAYGLANTPASLQITSLNSGETLLQKNENTPLNPASNMKLVTTAGALKTLGPNYVFHTDFYATSSGKGRLSKLWIRGGGDPFLVTEDLEDIVNALWDKGVRQVDEVALDDSFFDSDHRLTYSSTPRSKLYTIITGPLSFNFNNLLFAPNSVVPFGDISDQNEESFSPRKNARLRSQLATKNKTPLQLLREYGVQKGQADPAFYTGAVMMEALKKKGIAVGNKLTREEVSPRSTLMYRHDSEPLSEVLKGLCKHSNNFMAEQVLKTIGAEQGGLPGTQAKGIHVLQDYLTSLGIPQNEFLLENGSGLSQNTRLSANHLVNLLTDMYHSPYREPLIESLSIAGIDGTLRRRMKQTPLAGRVFAKTGTLNNVRTLSGYYFDKNNKGYAFSFLFNNLKVSVDKVVLAEQALLQLAQKKSQQTQLSLRE